MGNTKQYDKYVMCHTALHKAPFITLSSSEVHIRYLCLCC